MFTKSNAEMPNSESFSVSTETGEFRPVTPSQPKIQYRTCTQWPQAGYFIALPDTVNETTPVFVAIHGISRNAREQVAVFSQYCTRLGWIVVAPLFTKGDFRKYQQPGISNKKRGARADLSLNAILDEVTTLTKASTDRVYMFGYSGGAQFVHRYIMAYPDRVCAAALGAAGWYTFPDLDKAYPYGLGANSELSELSLIPELFLSVPMMVLVGTQDDKRDSSLNMSERIDRQQGQTRLERGQRWIESMRNAARSYGLDTRYEFRQIKECGHSFVQCVSMGKMDWQIMAFLTDSARSLKPHHVIKD